MKLYDAIVLYSGGPGSGCNPQAGRCGRLANEQNEMHQGLSPRAQRALATYVPVTSAKYQLAKRSERAVAKALNGVTTSDNAPFDVIVGGKIGVEVKTIIEGQHDKITVHPDSLKEKAQEMKRLGLQRAYTVVADHRAQPQTWYAREGVGSFRLGTFDQMMSVSELKKAVK